MSTWYLSNTNSDLSGGSDFTKMLSSTTESADSITLSVAASSTETSVAFTQLFSPNNIDWETGGITVKVNVTAADTFMRLAIGANRVSSTGTILESATTTAEQGLSFGGVFTFNVASKNWTASSDNTNRLKIAYLFRNSSSKGAQSVTIETGTSDTSVATSITNTPMPRLSHKVAFPSTKNLAQGISFEPMNPSYPSGLYRRKLIDAGTSHDELKVGYTFKVTGLQTGYIEEIADNGIQNEAIEHPARNVAYYNNALYVCWHGYPSSGTGNWRIYMRKFSYGSETWGSIVDVADSGTANDLHNYPSLLITSNGKVHLFYGTHNDPINYIRSTNAEDITSWETPATIGSGADYISTYPKAIQRSNGDIYVFSRDYNENGAASWYAFSKSTDGGVNWGAKQKVAHYASPYTAGPGWGVASIYNGGLVIDGNDRVHLVLDFHDGYQGLNRGRYITYLYSDDMTSWKKIDGTTIGTTQTDPVLETDIEKIFESGDPWPDDGPFWHTNSESLALDSNNYPYFLVGDTGPGTVIENSSASGISPLWLCRWSGSAWVKTELSALTDGQEAWSRRYIGVLYIDGDEINIYCTSLPSGTEDYFGGEIFKYRSTDLGANWAQFYITKNSGYGIPQMSVLPTKPSGRNREIVMTRGRYVYRWEDKVYTYALPGGDDIRIYRHTQTGNFTYSNTELDRLPKDQFGLTDTDLYFKLDKKITANWPYPHPYDKYYAYFHGPLASGPPKDVLDVVVFFDGAESYTRNSQVQGQNGWSGSANFTVTDNVSDEVKIYSGYKSIELIATAADDYLERTVSLSEHIVDVALFKQDASEGRVYLEFRDSGSGDWFRVGVGLTYPAYRRDTDGAWVDYTGIEAPSQQFHRVTMKISSSGVSAWINDTQIITNDTHMTSCDRLRLGGALSTTIGYYDDLMTRMWVSDAENVTLGADEYVEEITSKRLAHKIIPHYLSHKKLAQSFQLVYPEQTRNLAHRTVPDKTILTRLSGSITGQITTSKRFRHEIDRVYLAEKKLSHSIIREVGEVERIAERIAADKIEIKKLSHGSTLEAAEIARLANKIAGEISSDAKLSHILDLVYLADKRLSHKSVLEKALFLEVIHQVVPEMVERKNLSHKLVMEYSAIYQLCQLVAGDAIRIKRQSHLLDVTNAVSKRLAQLIVGEIQRDSRFAHAVAGDKAAQIRLAHRPQVEKPGLKRLAHRIAGDAPAVLREAHNLSLQYLKEQRLAALLDLEASTFKRLGQEVPFAAVGTLRVGSYVQLVATLSVRLHNAVAGETSDTERVAQEVDAQAPSFKRIAHQIIVEIVNASRQSHSIVGSKPATTRLAEKADPQQLAEKRLAELIATDKVAYNRLISAIIFIAPVQQVKLLNARGTSITLESPVPRSIQIANAAARGVGLSNPSGYSITLTNARGRAVNLDNPTVQ